MVGFRRELSSLVNGIRNQASMLRTSNKMVRIIFEIVSLLLPVRHRRRWPVLKSAHENLCRLPKIAFLSRTNAQGQLELRINQGMSYKKPSEAPRAEDLFEKVNPKDPSNPIYLLHGHRRRVLKVSEKMDLSNLRLCRTTSSLSARTVRFVWICIFLLHLNKSETALRIF